MIWSGNQRPQRTGRAASMVVAQVGQTQPVNTASSLRSIRLGDPSPWSGTWERYSFRVGNLLFLMMSDINEPTQKVGRGTLGGNPGGVVSGETFRWWQQMARSKPIVHYHQCNTTMAFSKTRPSHPVSGEGSAARLKRTMESSLSRLLLWKERHKAPHSFTGVDSKQDSGAFENF